MFVLVGKSKISNREVKIAIVGMGYVGLPTALAFSKRGFSVIGLDINKERVKYINNGISPISDPIITSDLKTEIENKRFSASDNYGSTIPQVDIILIAVPTPVNEAKEPDLTSVINAANSISKYLKQDQLVVLESTVYPGVTEDIVQPILEKSNLKTPQDFGLAYCPERFNPGDPNKTVEKVVRVVGGISKKWTDVAIELYSQIQETYPTIDIKTAEAAKVIENTQRDLNIALMNELALICERLNIDIIDVIDAASTKWNFNRYMPGPGVGGHCLPHDPFYLVKIAKEKGYHAQVILAGRRVNDEMPLHVRDLLIAGLNYQQKSLSKSKILVFGATYKKNIDDIRTSPTETLIRSLKKYNSIIIIHEPNVNEKDIFNCGNIHILNEDIVSNFNALVFMVAHDKFNKIDYQFLGNCIDKNSKLIIVDGARMFDGTRLKKLGYIYLGVGAGKINNSY